MQNELYPHLFEPLTIGPVTIRNRIVFGPHGTRLQEANLPSERHAAYFGARASGGAGLIILEVVPVLPRAPADSGPYMSPYKPGAVEGWSRIADVVHGHGAKIFHQLADSGLRASAMGARDREPLRGPSAIPLVRGGEIPRPMSESDIDYLVESFVLTAQKVKAAGFDGIELHAAHGYHLHLWMSAQFNRREDRFGGDAERRCAVPLMVARAVRDAVGRDFAIGMRISSSDYTPGGITVEDAVENARILDASRLLDYLNISAGFGADFTHVIPPMYAERGLHIEQAAQITRAVRLPTMARGRVVTPEHAERIVARGDAAMVCMVRALIADPELPNKALAGRAETIRTCVGANECVARNQSFVPIGCIYNPAAGNELRFEAEAARIPPPVPKTLLVIGGGPAGCEAARAAAELGHRVTLIERGSSLGGQLNLARRAPGRKEIGGIVSYFESELTRLGVDIRLNQAATDETIRASGADVVVLATGSRPLNPDVPLEGVEVISASASLDPLCTAGDRVVVYVEALHLQGLSAADYWATQGRSVAIYTPHEVLGYELDGGTRKALMQRLAAAKVPIHTGYRLTGAGPANVRLAHVQLGTTIEHACDTLIHDCGVEPVRELETSSVGIDGAFYLAGDCATARGVEGATRDGARIARSIH